jgi:hypothetical protein
VVSRAPSRDSQAWLLVELAHTLRRHGRCGEALGTLDLAVELHATTASELAAYTCAVAIHLAAGSPETAAKVAGTARAEAINSTLMRRLADLHLELFHETGEPAHLDEAFTCFELAAFEDALS